MPYGGFRYWLLPLLRLRVWRVEGLEHLPKRGGYLIAANHNAWLDTPLLVSLLYRRLDQQIYFISRSRHYTSLGSVAVHPDHPSGVIPICLDYLRGGHVVAVFPEGVSNPGPTLRRPKTGIARLAHLSALPVVPVGIRGTFGVNALLSTLCYLSVWRPITFRIGPPLTFPQLPEGQLTKELLTKTANRIMDAVSPLAGKPFPPQTNQVNNKARGHTQSTPNDAVARESERMGLVGPNPKDDRATPVAEGGVAPHRSEATGGGALEGETKRFPSK